MQYRDDSLLDGLKSQHYAERMQDVGRSGFVDLPGVRLGGDGDGPLECAHELHEISCPCLT